MNPEQCQRLEDILVAAVEVEPPRRAAFCDKACAGDREMRAELDRLLEGHDRAEDLGFLDAAAWRLESAQQMPEADMIGKTIGQYEIQKKIGEKAGMGDVYLAVEKSRGEVIRKVVIKFAQERLGPDERKRFDDEVRILAALEHNHIARMYNFGVFEEQPYFVMEHLDGVSLHQFLTEKGQGGGLQLDVAGEITKQACAGLRFAHEKGVIHRDIKPQNIMVLRSGGQLQVKVIDFGIAKASFGGTRKATSGPIGTPNYLSPEQIAPTRFGPVDQRADIYAMGLVVHELLTGRMVVSGAELMELLQKQLNETPPAPGIHREVDAVIMKAVQKKQAERQATIGEFAAQFDRAIQLAAESETLLDNKRIDPVPPPPLSRKWAWAMAAVLALAVTAGLAKTYWPTPDSGNPAPQFSPPAAAVVSPTPGVAIERPPSPPDARVEIPKITLLQLQNGQLQTVPSDTLFHGGDKVRFTVQSPHDGFLYLLQQGSTGRFSVLIPDQRIRAGNHWVKGGDGFVFPPTRYFEFNKAPGVETIYIFIAKEKTDPLAAAIERSIGGGKLKLGEQALLNDDTARMLTAASKSDDGKPAAVQVLKLKHE